MLPLSLVLAERRVLHRKLRGCGCVPVPASGPVRPRKHAQSSRELHVVAGGLEERQAAVGFGDHPPRPVLGLGRMAADPQAEEPGAGPESRLAALHGHLDRLVEEGLRPGELSDRHHRLRQVGQAGQPVVAVGGQERDRAAKEVAAAGMSPRANARWPAEERRAAARTPSWRPWSSRGPSSERHV